MVEDLKPPQRSVICSLVFTEIMGFSDLSPDERPKRLQQLTQMVNEIPTVQKNQQHLLLSQTDDGIAIVFFNSPEYALHCALCLHKSLEEYNRERKETYHLKLRTGLNLGSVYHISDSLSGKTRVVGNGMNTAQRVMSFGQQGHILASRVFRNFLTPLKKHYRSLFHPIGTYADKHQKPHELFNVYTRDIGNPRIPGNSETLPESRLESYQILQEEIHSVTGSLLFTDIVGFSKLSNQIQRTCIQDLYRIVTELSVIQEVSHHKPVIRSTGDGVLVCFFEAPERALFAALAIATQLKNRNHNLPENQQFQLRMGIHIGLVFPVQDVDGTPDITGIGKDMAKTVMDFGDAGHIIANKDTFELISSIDDSYHDYFNHCGLFQDKDGHPFDLYLLSEHGIGNLSLPTKGKVLPNQQPMGSEQPPALPSEFDFPLVGRKKEMNLLSAISAQFKNGKGQTIFIAGEAGIGKSRLVHEFKQMLAPDRQQIYESECEKFLTHVVPLAPFKDLIRQIMGHYLPKKKGLDMDTLANTLSRIRGDLDNYAMTIGQSMLDLVTDHTPPEIFQKEKLFYALKSLLEGIVSHTPLVISIDDMHWADQSTLDLWLYLSNALRHLPIVFICTFRNEVSDLEHLRQAIHLLSRNANFTMIELQRLPEEETANLLKKRYSEQQFPTRFFQFVHQETEGTPFYIQALLELLENEHILYKNPTGIWSVSENFKEFPMPSSIESLILERMSHIDTRQMELLNIASVIGKTFDPDIWKELLKPEQQACFEDELENFLHLHIIKERADGNLEFAHIKIQEVLYRNIASERKRRLLHEKVAQKLAQKYLDSTTMKHLIGYHFYRADCGEKALPYLIAFGRQAMAIYAIDEALIAFQRGLELVEKQPQQYTWEIRYTLFRELGNGYLKKPDWKEASRCFQQAYQLRQEKEGQEVEQGHILLQLGEVQRLNGDVNAARQYFQQAEALGQIHDQQLLADAYQYLGTLFMDMSDWEQAMHYYHQCRHLYQTLGNSASLNELWLKLSQVFYQLGEWEQALQLLGKSEAYYQQQVDLWKMAVIERTKGNVYRAQGQHEKAILFYEKERQILEELGDEHGLGIYYYNQGNMAVDASQLELALNLYKKSRDLYEKIGDYQGLAYVYNNMGDVLKRQEEWETALSNFEKTRILGEKLQNKQIICYSYINMAEIFQQKTDFQQALHFYQQALAQESQDSFALAHIFSNMAAIYQTQQQYEHALELYQESSQVFKELSQEKSLLSVYESMADIYRLTSHTQLAIEYARKAIDLAQRLSDIPSQERLQELLKNLGNI